MDITTTFLKYESARNSGQYNMITDACNVMNDYEIDSSDYWYIVENYKILKEQYYNE